MKTEQMLLVILGVLPVAFAQSPVWGQCGGSGWTGPKTCVAGSTCVASNEYYSQCIPSSSSSASSVKTTSTLKPTTKAVTTTKSAISTSVVVRTTTPKLLICSDSTTANYSVLGTLQGWGFHIQNFTTLNVVNLAKNGRSTRSFINEGLWATLLSQTVAGDYVLIEHGHNDDADPTTDTKFRGVLPGIGEETVTVTGADGNPEVVHTFGWYLRKMAGDVRAKGAIPVFSGMVNRNYWTGDVLQSNWPFATYASQTAAQLSIEYIDHTNYSVIKFQSFGPTLAKTYFPNDNTHTDDGGAIINAETFVTAVKCKSPASQLKAYLNAIGNAVSQAC